MHLKVEPNIQSVFENPFGQPLRVEDSMNRRKVNRVGPFRQIPGIEGVFGEFIVFAVADHEFDLVLFGQPGQVRRVIAQVLPARRAFDVHYSNAPVVDRTDIPAAVGLHKNLITRFEQLIDQSGGFRLQHRFSPGDFHERPVESGDPIEYGIHRHRLPLMIGIPRVAIPAPKIAPRQADKDGGPSGIGGFSLNAVKDFIYSERQNQQLRKKWVFLDIHGYPFCLESSSVFQDTLLSWKVSASAHDFNIFGIAAS